MGCGGHEVELTEVGLAAVGLAEVGLAEVGLAGIRDVGREGVGVREVRNFFMKIFWKNKEKGSSFPPFSP